MQVVVVELGHVIIGYVGAGFLHSELHVDELALVACSNGLE